MDISSSSDPLASSTELAKATDGNAQPATSAAELSKAIDQMLENLQRKFGAISNDMLSKMEDMSRRLDNLEAHINAQSMSEDKPN